MTDLGTIARNSALQCEAKKHGYRQTQDGVVVSFVLHPQDVPDALATAALGTRYVVALVEIGDDEKPVAGARTASARGLTPVTNESRARNPGGDNARINNDTHQNGKATASDEPAPKRSQPWNETSLAQQAGILCNEKSFHKFLEEYCGETWQDFGHLPDSNLAAAMSVRKLCQVATRADILPGTPAGTKWKELASFYRTWMREPEFVA